MSEDDTRVSFDESRWPVVVVHLPSRGTVATIDAWYDHVEALLERTDRPLGLVYDLRALELSSGSWAHRRAIANRSVRMRERGLHARIAADARVFDRALSASVLSVVDWLTGDRPWPQRSFESLDDAIAWADACTREGSD